MLFGVVILFKIYLINYSVRSGADLQFVHRKAESNVHFEDIFSLLVL